MTDTLPFTSTCSQKHNFPDEYTDSLKWRCTLYDGHAGDCAPPENEQRWYDRRVAMRLEHLPPGTFVMDEKVLRKIVGIAIRESDDSGVMWLRITRVLGFNAWMRSIDSAVSTEQSPSTS